MAKNKLKAEEILKRNIHYLLLQKGMSYADLPITYTPAIRRNGEHFNPTLDTIEKIATTLGVQPYELINPDIELRGMIDLPDGFTRINIVVSEVQAAAIKQAESITLRRIREIKQAKLELHRRLAE